MPFVDTSRLRMYYRTHGDPDGLPMLLLHGSFGSSRWWEPLFDTLAEDIYAIAPDLRGSGQSDKPQGGYDIASLAQDVAAFSDALNLRGVDVVGHASGAAVALDLTLVRPARIATLTLVDPPPLEGVVTPVEALMALEEMRTNHALLRAGLAAMAPNFFNSDVPGNQIFGEQLVEDAIHQAPAAFTEIAVGLASWNRVREAGTLALPTLIIWGDQDTLVDRESVNRTLLAIPGASNLEVLRGVGHAPMLDAPFRLVERLLTFTLDDYANYEAIRSQAE
jgi:pimeloyl-ACP methyl ester carboxylesterase